MRVQCPVTSCILITQAASGAIPLTCGRAHTLVFRRNTANLTRGRVRLAHAEEVRPVRPAPWIAVARLGAVREADLVVGPVGPARRSAQSNIHVSQAGSMIDLGQGKSCVSQPLLQSIRTAARRSATRQEGTCHGYLATTASR